MTKSELIDIAYPLGQSYVQYPRCKSPNILFPGTQWEIRAYRDYCTCWVRIK